MKTLLFEKIKLLKIKKYAIIELLLRVPLEKN